MNIYSTFIDYFILGDYHIFMIKKYKTAAYHFDSEKGLTNEVINSIDEWLNSWLAAGYFIDKISEITKEGKTCGYFYVFKQVD